MCRMCETPRILADISVGIELTSTPWKKHHLVLYLGTGKTQRVPITRAKAKELQAKGIPVTPEEE